MKTTIGFRVWEGMIICIVAILACIVAACSPGGILAQATPTRAYSSPIDAYLIEVDGDFESMDSSIRSVRAQLAALDKDPSQAQDPAWRATLTSALLQLRQDFQTIMDFQPPSEVLSYHKAILDADSHADKAAALLLTWLDDHDQEKYTRAVRELDAEEAGLGPAQKILDSLQGK